MSRNRSRCKALVSTLSTRPARIRAKCASVARVSRSRNTSFSCSNWRAARASSVMNTAAAAWTLPQPLEHGADLGLAFGREGEAAFQALGGDRDQALVDDVAGMFEIGDEGEDLAQPAIVGIVERLRVEPGQINLDRAVEPVEYIVEPLGRGELLAVAAIERIECAAQHRFDDIGHA